MANIKKIFEEELDKIKPILESCKSIYFKGSSSFDEIVEGIVKDSFSEDFYNSIKEGVYFMIVKTIPTDDTRIVFFWWNGFYIYSFTSAFWKDFKIKEIDPAIEQKFIEYEEINKLTVDHKRKTPYIKIDTKSRKNDIIIKASDIFEKKESKEIINAIFSFINDVHSRINDDDKNFDSLSEELEKAKDENEWNKYIKICDELLSMDPEDYELIRSKAYGLSEQGDFEKASMQIEIALDKFYKIIGDINSSDQWDDDDKSFFAVAKRVEAEILKNQGQYHDSIKSYNDSIRFESDEEEKRSLINSRDNGQEMLLSNFETLHYSMRKLIFVDNELSFYNPTNIIPLDLSKISSLKFPPSHPVSGQLYVGHPFKNDLYFPIEDYENHLFESQVMELSRLLKSLGAVKITTEYITSSSSLESKESNNSSSSQNTDSKSGGGSGIIYSGEASKKSETSQNKHAEQQTHKEAKIGKKLSIDGVFKPKHQPYIPNDLVWFDDNEIWQSLAKQRLEGGLESYDITLSTHDVEQVSTKELEKIDKEYKKLLKVSAGTKVMKIHAEHENESNKSESTESLLDLKKTGTTNIRILVDFAPIDELTEPPPISAQIDNNSTSNLSSLNSQYSDNEKDYLELLNDAIEDGVIEKASRKILEKRRTKLGISETRAIELEDSIVNKSNLTDEEEDYVELLNDAIEDGVIEKASRKILEKRRTKLGISEEKAKELEELALVKFNN